MRHHHAQNSSIVIRVVATAVHKSFLVHASFLNQCQRCDPIILPYAAVRSDEDMVMTSADLASLAATMNGEVQSLALRVQ